MGFNRTVVGCVGFLLVGAVLAAGCAQGGGGGQTTTTKGSTTGASEVTRGSTVAESLIQTIQINETEFRLDPDEITLDKPGRYVFRANNVGSTIHALVVESKEGEESEATSENKEGGEEEQRTRNLNPGESADLEVNLKAGTYEIYCPVDNHEDMGMKGTVTVKEG